MHCSRISRSAFIALSLAAFLSVHLLAQTSMANVPAASSLPEPEQPIPTSISPDLVPPQVPDSYIIGQDDLLSIFVYEMPDMTRQVRVGANGTILLPLLPNPIKATGLRSTQLAASVAQALEDSGLANRPEVQVTVRQVMSKPVIVSGAVKNPRVLQAARPMTLAEALARAGGAASNAGPDAIISRPGTADQTISLQNLIDGTGPDPILYGGENVRVTTARLVYVVGAMQRPGAFPIQAGDPVTVLKALALAEGFSSTVPADKRNSIIIRSAPGKPQQEIPIDLDQLLSHRKPDVTLQAGDILYVPESGRRKVLNGVMTNLGQGLAIALGYGASRF